MAQPLATAKRIKTAETDWPLRPHVQEQRQNVIQVFFPFYSSATPANNIGIASIQVSIPYDVKAIEIDGVASTTAGTPFVPMIVGFQELSSYFGNMLHTFTPNTGSAVGVSRHEFMRPVPMQGQKLTLNLYQPDSTSTTGIPKVYSESTAVAGVLRISFIRNPK